MNLMPIIYTSLVLFFGVLLIVIALSYLTYKTKSKINPVIAEEVKKRQKNFVVIKHNQYIDNQPQSLLQTSVTPSVTYPSYNNIIPVEQLKNIKHTFSYENRRSNNYENRFDEDVLHYQPRSRENENRTTVVRPRLTNSRIEIINETRSFKKDTNAARVEKSNRRFHSNHANLNLLNFYSDDSDSEFNVSSAHYKAV
jgi:hypothetical protein